MWRAITEADVLQAISGEELSTVREAALADGQPDPVAGKIAQVMETARGYIEAAPGAKLGPRGTVPERLIESLCAIMAVDILARVAGMQIDPKGARATAKANAIARLEQVAAGAFAIDAPTEIGTDAKAVQTPCISRRRRHFRSRQQEGV
ncbi:MAG: hypothetical protein R6X19_03380 [Kiritimatiellia bacterium]